MNDPILIEREALIGQVTDALGDLASIVTIDTQDARPLPGKVAVFIQPPDLAWPSWDTTPDITWKAAVVAGTPATQGDSLDLLYSALQKLAEHQVNIVKAEPVGYQNGTGGDLAAYLVTFGTITI